MCTHRQELLSICWGVPTLAASYVRRHEGGRTRFAQLPVFCATRSAASTADRVRVKIIRQDRLEAFSPLLTYSKGVELNQSMPRGVRHNLPARGDTSPRA